MRILIFTIVIAGVFFALYLFVDVLPMWSMIATSIVAIFGIPYIIWNSSIFRKAKKNNRNLKDPV